MADAKTSTSTTAGKPGRKAVVPKGEDGKSTETPAERFRRLVNFRMPKVLNRLDQIANLAGPMYEGTAEQKEKIVHDLYAKVQQIEAAFAPKGRAASKETWTL